jgi:hypothetical protein
VRWVPDAAAIIAGGQVDWPALVERAPRHEVTLILAATLRYLRERMDVAIPAEVLEPLDATPVTRFERWSYEAAMGPRTLRAAMRKEWFRYRRVSRVRSWPGFLHFLRVSMGYQRRRDLVRHMVQRVVRGEPLSDSDRARLRA